MRDIIQVAYFPNGSFVLPLITRLRSSSTPDVRALAQKWADDELGLLGISLSTKITMLGLLAPRLYGKLLPLTVELGQTDVPAHLAGGYAWTPSQRDLPYEALLELDSFIFEFRSTYEILGKFLRRFSELVLGKAIAEADLQRILADRGIDVDWAGQLQTLRKFWFHEHAPWLAYRIAKPSPLDSEPLFLLHSNADPSIPDEAVPASHLGRIYSGFDKALQQLQQWAMDEIARLEGGRAV